MTLLGNQANNNLIKDFSQVEAQLKAMKDLDTVYLEGNPLQKDLGSAYRRRIVLALPQLSQLDATYVFSVNYVLRCSCS